MNAGLAHVSRAANLTHDVGEILSRDRLLLEEGGDDSIEGVSVIAQQSPCPVLGLGEQAADLLVDDLLRALGIGSFLAEWGTAQVRGLVRSVPDWSRAGATIPIPVTILMASSVAPARSLAAPVEASPITRFSEARPPRRMAKESRR